MTKTYTPLIIEGKIYVVVDIPEPPRYEKGFHIEWHKERAEQLAACTKYPTIESDAPYWEERIGQRVEVVIGQFFKWNDGNYMNTCAVCSERFMHGAKRQPVCKPCCETTYAIPPQQKQDKNSTFPYLTSEYDLQVEKMDKLGINTTGCTFEQSVNAALFMLTELQKQGDLWDEVQSRFNAWLFEDGEASLDDIFNELKSNYSLKRK